MTASGPTELHKVIETLRGEREALLHQNRELVTEIRIRDGMISDLQNRLAALEHH